MITIQSSTLREGRWYLVEGKILIQGLMRFPSTLTFYDVAHYLPRGGAPSLRMKPEGISHTSLVRLDNYELELLKNYKYNFETPDFTGVIRFIALW